MCHVKPASFHHQLQCFRIMWQASEYNFDAISAVSNWIVIDRQLYTRSMAESNTEY